MQMIKVGELECIVTKTGESLFILGVSGGYMEQDKWYHLNNLLSVSMNSVTLNLQTSKSLDWGVQYPRMEAERFYLYISRYEQGQTLCRSEFFITKDLPSVYRELGIWQSDYSCPEWIEVHAKRDALTHPDRKDIQENAKVLLALHEKIQGHLPRHYMDICGVRIVLNATTKSMSPEDIIVHAVTNDQSSITVGSIRVSWENPEALGKGEFKYKYRTCRAALDEIIKLHRSWKVELEDAKLPYKMYNNMYIAVNRDPKVTNDDDRSRLMSIDTLLGDAEKAISRNTDMIRAYLSSAVVTTMVDRKVIYVKGWEIVAGYQSLCCESCMVGRHDDYSNYLVEPYAHSPSCTLALYIEANKEEEIREHLADVATKCERGRHNDDWHHPGIIARSMVWDIKDHGAPTSPKGWYDRMYVNTGERSSKKTTTCNSFAAAMEAEGYSAWRTVSGRIHGIETGKGYLDLHSISDGGWNEDRWIGLPYMDSFEYGLVKSGGIVRCYATKSSAVDQGAPSKKLFSLKCSGGLQEIHEVVMCACSSCGDSFDEEEEPLNTFLTRDGTQELCSGCAEDFVPLDGMYNRRAMTVYERADDCFFCESTGTYFLDGDEVPDHIQLDNGDWVPSDSEEAIEFLAAQEKEADKEVEVMVSCICDASDLRRRARMPLSECVYHVPGQVYVHKDQYEAFLLRADSMGVDGNRVSLGEPERQHVPGEVITLSNPCMDYGSNYIRVHDEYLWDITPRHISDMRRDLAAAIQLMNNNYNNAMDEVITNNREVV